VLSIKNHLSGLNADPVKVGDIRDAWYPRCGHFRLNAGRGSLFRGAARGVSGLQVFFQDFTSMGGTVTGRGLAEMG